MVIDLTDLEYCDSAGIRALLRAAARCDTGGVRYETVGAHGIVRRVFEVTDTVEALHVVDGPA
jgi:anti-anti-sigma factor